MKNSCKLSRFIVNRCQKAALSRLSTIDYQLSTRRGQSLIEVVISAGISVILAIALISTSLIVQKTARAAKNNTQATKLAQETIEQLRVMRDRKGFAAITSGDCQGLNAQADDPSSWNLTSECGQPVNVEASGTKFSRKISVIENGNNKTITVTISWEEAGGQKFVTSQTILSKWEL